MAGGTGTSAPVKRSTIDWDAAPFGRMSDEEIARMLGVTRQAVGLQRRRRGIQSGGSPLIGAITTLELEQLGVLELGLARILDTERPCLSFAVGEAVAQTPGWRIEMRRARAGEGRATAFRFKAPGRRSYTEWQTPAAARVWLLSTGWADTAAERADDLRRMKSAAARRSA